MKKIIYIMSAMLLGISSSLHAMGYFQQALSWVSTIGYSADEQLYDAVMADDVNKVQELLQANANANATVKKQFNVSIFSIAVLRGNMQIISLLLEHGADVNAKALLLYAVKNCRIDLVELLLKHGADVNAKDCDDDTALLVACSMQHGEQAREYSPIISLLLNYDADVNVTNSLGIYSALKWAIQLGNISTVRRLIEHGVSMRLPDNQMADAWAYNLRNSSINHNYILGIVDAHTVNLATLDTLKQSLTQKSGNCDYAALLKQAVICHDIKLIALILANGYRPEKTIFQQPMTIKSKKILQEYFDTAELLFCLQNAQEAQHTLGTVPPELMLYVLDAIAIERLNK